MPWGLKPDEVRDLMLSVGGEHLADRPLTPVEVASLFHLAILNGASKKDCAALVHLRNTSMVSRFLSLLKLSKEIRHNVEFDRPSHACVVFTSAFEISRLNAEDHEPCIRAVVENGLSTSEVKELVQLRQRSSREICECIDQIVELRPKVERRYMFIGAIAENAVVQKLRQMRQSDRDRMMAEIVKELCGGVSDADSRLGSDRFSIVGGEAMSEHLNRIHQGFEAAIISKIKSRLCDE